jgi:glyoxylase-like metal-dependent hydrolase (beta-lactamase superfamily II)
VQHLAIESDPAEVRSRRDEIALIDGGKRLTPDREVTPSGPHQLDGLELHLETFAVTAGDVWAFDRRTGILAAGDLVTLPIPLLDTACPEGWEKALDHLAATPFEQLVPGHGEPMNQLGLAAYRDAFHALRVCAASHRDKDACIDGWLNDAGPLVPPGDVGLARQSLGYYVAAVLRGDPVKRAKLCGPGV